MTVLRVRPPLRAALVAAAVVVAGCTETVPLPDAELEPGLPGPEPSPDATGDADPAATGPAREGDDAAGSGASPPSTPASATDPANETRAGADAAAAQAPPADSPPPPLQVVIVLRRAYAAAPLQDLCGADQDFVFESAAANTGQQPAHVREVTVQLYTSDGTAAPLKRVSVNRTLEPGDALPFRAREACGWGHYDADLHRACVTFAATADAAEAITACG